MRLCNLVVDTGSIDAGSPTKNYVLTRYVVPLEMVTRFWLDYDTKFFGLGPYDEEAVRKLNRINPPEYIELGQKSKKRSEKKVYDLGDITEQELAVLIKFRILVRDMTDKY